MGIDFLQHYIGQVDIAEATLRRTKLQLLVFKATADKLPEMPKLQLALFVDSDDFDALIALIRKGGKSDVADFIQEIVNTN